MLNANKDRASYKRPTRIYNQDFIITQGFMPKKAILRRNEKPLKSTVHDWSIKNVHVTCGFSLLNPEGWSYRLLKLTCTCTGIYSQLELAYFRYLKVGVKRSSQNFGRCSFNFVGMCSLKNFHYLRNEGLAKTWKCSFLHLRSWLCYQEDNALIVECWSGSFDTLGKKSFVRRPSMPQAFVAYNVDSRVETHVVLST